MEKKKLKIFCWHTPGETLVSALEGLFGLGLTLAFVYYRIYVAVAVMVCVLLLLLVYQLRFILVSETDIKQFHWGHIDVTLPVEEIERIDTQAEDKGKGCMACIYSEKDVLELPYRRKTFEAVLELLGIDEDVRKRFFDREAEDFVEESAGFRVTRATVNLDAFVGKEAFTHRKLEKISERDISG